MTRAKKNGSTKASTTTKGRDGFATSDDLLGVGVDHRETEIEIAGGGTKRVYLKHLSAGDIFAFNRRVAKDKGEQDAAMVLLITRSVCDGEGRRLWTDRDIDRVLRTIPIATFGKLSAEVMEMAGISVPAGGDAGNASGEA